jgi:hypothetical protein
MSIDVRNSWIVCDGDNCKAVLAVPLKMRKWRDGVTRELKWESSATGWTFLHGIRTDRHYCPLCSESRSQKQFDSLNASGAYL